MKKIRNPFRRRDGSSLVHVGSSVVMGASKLKVLSKEAEGGSAFIFKVKDSARGTVYALKQLILADSDEVEMQYIYEKSTLEALKGHPNVVRLYHATVVEAEDGHREGWMLLEYCSVSLVKLLAGIEKNHEFGSSALALPEADTLAVMASVLAALTALHTLSPSPLAHRDIKAENVLLGADGKWKLCDFGSVSSMSGVLASAAAAGREQLVIDRTTTPNYRPPEMWDLELSRKPLGIAVDMWMLGCLLYRICFGSMPFTDAAKLQILQGRFTVPQRYATSTAADVRFFISLINQLLVVEPSVRLGAEEALAMCEKRMAALQSDGSAMASIGDDTGRGEPEGAVGAAEPTAGGDGDALAGDGDGGGGGGDAEEATVRASGTKIKLTKLGRMLGRGSNHMSLGAAGVAYASGLRDDEQDSAEVVATQQRVLPKAPSHDGARAASNKPLGREATTAAAPSTGVLGAEHDDMALKLKLATETIRELREDRDVMAARITQLEELALRQRQVIEQLRSPGTGSSPFAATTPPPDDACAVETGWATAWSASPAMAARAGALQGDEREPAPGPTARQLVLESPQAPTAPKTVSLDDFFGMAAVDSGHRGSEGMTQAQVILTTPTTAAAGDSIDDAGIGERAGNGSSGGGSSSSSSDGGYDENVNFSISSRNNSLVVGNRATPLDPGDSSEQVLLIQEGSILDDVDARVLHPPSLPHGSGNDSVDELLAMTVDAAPSTASGSGPVNLLDDVGDAAALPSILTSNPFHTSSIEAPADTGQKRQEAAGATKDGDEQQLQDLISRTLNLNRRRSSSDRLSPIAAVVAADEARSAGRHARTDSSGRSIHGRSLSNAVDMDSFDAVADVLTPPDSAPSAAALEPASVSASEVYDEQEHMVERWSTVAL